MTATLTAPSTHGTVVRTFETPTGSAPVVYTPVAIIDDPRATAFIAIVWAFVIVGFIAALTGVATNLTTDNLSLGMTLLGGGVSAVFLAAGTFHIVDRQVRARTGMRL